MQRVRFYRAQNGVLALPTLALGNLSLTRWQPNRDGPPRGLFASRPNWAWWAMDLAGRFNRPDLTVYAIHDGSRLLHRLLVTPRWWRFPFMGRDDLQFGMLWTDPAVRGKGLAGQAIAAAHADFAGECAAFWYLVDERNDDSIRLIERIGYSLIGTGERTRPLGFGALGQFKMRDLSASS